MNTHNIKPYSRPAFDAVEALVKDPDNPALPPRDFLILNKRYGRKRSDFLGHHLSNAKKARIALEYVNSEKTNGEREDVIKPVGENIFTQNSRVQETEIKEVLPEFLSTYSTESIRSKTGKKLNIFYKRECKKRRDLPHKSAAFVGGVFARLDATVERAEPIFKDVENVMLKLEAKKDDKGQRILYKDILRNLAGVPDARRGQMVEEAQALMRTRTGSDRTAYEEVLLQSLPWVPRIQHADLVAGSMEHMAALPSKDRGDMSAALVMSLEFLSKDVQKTVIGHAIALAREQPTAAVAVYKALLTNISQVPKKRRESVCRAAEALMKDPNLDPSDKAVLHNAFLAALMYVPPDQFRSIFKAFSRKAINSERHKLVEMFSSEIGRAENRDIVWLTKNIIKESRRFDIEKRKFFMGLLMDQLGDSIFGSSDVRKKKISNANKLIREEAITLGIPIVEGTRNR